MSVTTDTLRKLASLNLSSEQMAGVVDILADVQAAEDARKLAQRDRARKSRASRDGHVTVTREQRDGSHGRAARVEDKTLTSEIEPQKEEQKETRSTRDVSEFRSELHELDAERLDAVVKHRRSKRGQITGHAARLFRRDAEACDMSLAEAVDTCISRNWITVKPEFLANRQRAGPAGRPPDPTLAAAHRLQEKFNAVSPSEIEGNHQAPRLVAIGGRGG